MENDSPKNVGYFGLLLQLKKMSKVNNHPMGDNLVTLLPSSRMKSAVFDYKRG
jgi:hypothetical protein